MCATDPYTKILQLFSSFLGTFIVYAGCTIIGWVFIYYLVPETKDRNLEDVEKLFEKPWCAFMSSNMGYQQIDNSGRIK